jgi:hypothetical protein
MADACEGYNYWLAAQDVVPIVLGGVGFFCLANRVSARFPQLRVAVLFAATILVIGSAFAGPIRKSFLAAGAGCDSLDWMQIPFFSSMPIGFAILLWAVVCLLQDRKLTFLPDAIALCVLYAGAAFAERSLILIAIGGLFAIATGIACVILSMREKHVLTAVLFALYTVAIAGLPVLGSNEERADVGHQWLEQSTNTVAQALFALAAYRLLRAYQRAGDRPVLVEN